MNKVEVLFQDKDFLAVNKVAGISVHNNEDKQNLLLLLEQQLQLQKLYPVNRLDKETSGVQILALNSESARKLANEFQQRTVKKIYMGILRGQLKKPEGNWAHALTDKAEGRKNPAGMAKDRVNCETRYKVIKASQYFSLCEFDLITGRQHQIRKHSALDNHPLVGDPRYGEQKYNDKIAKIYNTDRMFLHCSKIQIFNHTIECPTPKTFDLLFSKDNNQ